MFCSILDNLSLKHRNPANLNSIVTLLLNSCDDEQCFFMLHCFFTLRNITSSDVSHNLFVNYLCVALLPVVGVFHVFVHVQWRSARVSYVMVLFKTS